MSDKTAILTNLAPAPAHSFSQGVRKGPFVQVSGQGPVDPATNEYVHPGDLTGQTRQTLANVLAIVEAAGATFGDVVMLRVYLTKRERLRRDERRLPGVRRRAQRTGRSAMPHDRIHRPAPGGDAHRDRRHGHRLSAGPRTAKTTVFEWLP